MNTTLLQHIKQAFQRISFSKPIFIFSPGRINLIGDHTDYNKGLVMPAAINKGIYLAIAKSNTSHSIASALDMNEHLEFVPREVQPMENGGWRNYILGVVGVLAEKGIAIDNFNLVFAGDIPQGAGLSSSAALENGLVYGLNILFRLGLTKKEMIYISQKAEHHYVGVQCGIMDQYANMFGKKNSAILLDCSDLSATYTDIGLKGYRILLVNTNVKHELAESAYNERRAACERIASNLGQTSLRDISEKDLISHKNDLPAEDLEKALYVIRENDRVLKAADAISCKDPVRLGRLLFESHEGLQHQYKVSCDELDFLVDMAKNQPGVTGSRMMGGGFGGCTINLVKEDAAEQFSKELSIQYKSTFNKECSIYDVHLSDGTHQIIN